MQAETQVKSFYPQVTIADVPDDYARIWSRLGSRQPQLMYSLDEPTLADFTDLTSPVILLEAEDKAIGFLTEATGNVAFVHFAVYPTTPFKDTSRLFQVLLQAGFTYMGYSGFLGLTPAPYRMAWRIAAQHGFTKVAELPDLCYMARLRRHVQGIISYIPRTRVIA